MNKAYVIRTVTTKHVNGKEERTYRYLRNSAFELNRSLASRYDEYYTAASVLAGLSLGSDPDWRAAVLAARVIEIRPKQVTK